MVSKSAANRKKSVSAKFWVGFGASAGGLEALRGLARNLPDNLQATYIVAQHMAPHHKSMLSEIIGRETGMQVCDVTDKLLPKANTIYITPPNQNIIVEKNRLRLIEPSKEPGAPKPSVDTFLKSLAKGKGKFALGIILSGTGSDGATGIKAVRESGGITIAQDELTAKYASMPLAAMETGCVDLVMSPEEIGAQISKIIQMPRDLDALKASPLSLDGVSELVQLLHDQTKVNFRHYKTATFQRRVERRMAATKTVRLEDYVEVARNSRKEVQSLFQDLLISVTSFFRDPVEFDALKPHIEKIVSEKDGQHIRIWIPGTATGEEAYSLAILFSEAMLENGATDNAKLQIFATDIDENAIEVARRGFYSQSALEQVPADLIEKYFENAPTGYTVKKMLREKMVFSLHNIAQDPPFLNIDMISCRNLLIYFQASLQAEVFSRFHYSMVPNGLLFLGKSEAVSASEALFRPAGNDKHIFYQRPSHERRPPQDMNFERPSRPHVRRPPPKPQTVAARELRESEEKLESLIRGLGKSAILIDSNLTVVKAYGDLDRYLGVSAGVVDTKVASLLRDPYRGDIQASAPGVIRNQKAAECFTRLHPENSAICEKITIYPLENGNSDETMALAVFKEWEDATFVAKSDDSNPSTNALHKQIAALGNELAIAKTSLQHTVEELETTNEELQALNEELQSSNEELQSTNEELETSNEELQSTNEELSTVNEELQVNAQQLSLVNQSLSSILENITIPLLVVDRNLNITNASGVSEEFFGISDDLSLPHAGRCKMREGYPNLVDAIQSGLDNGQPMQWHIDHEHESAVMRVIPHYSSSNELLGAIVLVSDNTDELKATRDELQLIFDNVPAAIMVRDRGGKILQANKAALGLLETSETDFRGKVFYDYFEKDIAAELHKADLDILKSGEAQSGTIQRVRYNNGKELWARMSRIPAIHPHKNEPAIYAVTQDITEQYRAEEALKHSELRLDQAIKASNAGLWDKDLINGSIYWSDRQKEILGVREIGHNERADSINSRIHPDDRDEVAAARRKHLEDHEPYDVTYRIRHERGHYIWVQSHGQATWNEDGAAIRLTGTLTDITEEREIQNAVKERKEQLELAAELSGVGYWKIDLVEDTVFWSDQVHLIHGTTSKEYEPELESAIQFYHADDVERIQNHVDNAVDKGSNFEFEARIIKADTGEVRNVRSIGTTDLSKKGKPIAIFGVFQDITEEKKKEVDLRQTLDELARSNEELNRFSYVCSHDMKEPVRMIESMATLLVNPDFNADEDKQNDLLKRISTNTSRLRAIIDSLLAYSRIDAKIDLDDTDLNKLVSELLDGLSLAIQEQDATVEVGDLPVIKGAPVHFTQLFQNLIGNALKFSDKRKPLVVISADAQKDGWRFLLEDNGPGIPESSRKDIFNLFSRLQRQDEIEGTGLGLSIAQRIVMQYGGAIKCTDSSLGGAAFEIFLPHREQMHA